MTSIVPNIDGPAGLVLRSQVRQTILWGEEGCSAELEIVRGIIEQSQPGSLTLRTRLSEAEADVGNAPDVRLLLVCRAPSSLMIEAMEEGAALMQALKTWSDRAADVLRVVRAHRRQTGIIDADQASRDPAALARQLHMEPPASPPTARVADPDPILAVIAAEAVRLNATSSSLAGEFAASTINLSSGLPEDIAERAFVLYHASKEETFLLRRQLTMLQEQSESDLFNVGKLRTRLKTQASQLKERTARFKTQTAKLQNVQDKAAKLREEVKRKVEELKSERKSIERLKSSRSYRLLAPLRWLRRRMQKRK